MEKVKYEVRIGEVEFNRFDEKRYGTPANKQLQTFLDTDFVDKSFDNEEEAQDYFDNLDLSVTKDCGTAVKYTRFEFATLVKIDDEEEDKEEIAIKFG